MSEKEPLPENPEDKGYRFTRLFKAVWGARRSEENPPKDRRELSDETFDKLTKSPNAFVEQNPDESKIPENQTQVFMYGASVSWLSYDFIREKVKLLGQRPEFEGQTFKAVNKNWPYRHTQNLIDWLNNPWQLSAAGVRDTSTSWIPFHNPMLPKIPKDAPPHIALIVMGGNDMLKHLDAVKAHVNGEEKDGGEAMSPHAFADGMVERMTKILNAMEEAGFKRVGVIPLDRENARKIISSLEIPEVMVDALGEAYQRIAEKYPDFVYVSPHDLYAGLDPETDYLDSPIQQDHMRHLGYLEPQNPLDLINEYHSWEKPVYMATLKNDQKNKRERVHPNPLGQAKVAKTMAETVREVELGMKSPCLDNPYLGFGRDRGRSRDPATNVTSAAESGVIQDMQREIAS